jgi:hypothetical protein
MHQERNCIRIHTYHRNKQNSREIITDPGYIC